MEQLELLLIGSRRLEGSELKERMLRAATGLAALGVSAGDSVAILMRNDLPQLEATLAAQHLGAYPVQINWHGSNDELAYVLADCGARTLVAHTDLLNRLPAQIRLGVTVLAVMPTEDIKTAYRINAESLQLPAGSTEWEAWLASHEPSSLPPKPNVESIIYTSGTTGKPKGVRRFASTTSQAKQTEAMRLLVSGIDAGARVLVPAPLYHTAPNLFALRAAKRANLLVLPARFDAASMLSDIERYRITHLYVVPTIFARLLALPEAQRTRHDLSSLQFVLHAGGPCPPSTKLAMLQWWGPIIHEYYGSTEAGPNTFCRGEEWIAKPGTIGRAIDGVCIEVHDDNGRALGAGEIGELCVRNDGYADFSYLNLPQARLELQRGDLLVSGDLGFFDEDGYYFLCDRKRDLVISGGVNIYPAEIEAVLLGMPGVADCAVFGIPDEEFGERLAALVEAQEDHGLHADAIRDFLCEKLASFKLPQLIELREHLPRDESGKIKKRLLRAPYWEGMSRSI